MNRDGVRRMDLDAALLGDQERYRLSPITTFEMAATAAAEFATLSPRLLCVTVIHRITNMNKLTLVSALIMLVATSGTYACSNVGAAPCVPSALLADARGDEQMRLLEPHERDEPGPLTVRVTTFDSSPSTPGVWYERPRGNIEDEALPQRRLTPRAPFDRH